MSQIYGCLGLYRALRLMRLALVGAVLYAASQHAAPETAYAPAGVGRWDEAVVTQGNIADTICKPGYTATVRSGKGGEFGAITASIKTKVYARDGKTPDHLPASHSVCCEIDHYFPLEIGGANVIANLWAESWEHPYGARDKDKVEDKLHKLVCSSGMPLQKAQTCLASDWIACGRQIGVLKVQ